MHLSRVAARLVRVERQSEGMVHPADGHGHRSPAGISPGLKGALPEEDRSAQVRPLDVHLHRRRTEVVCRLVGGVVVVEGEGTLQVALVNDGRVNERRAVVATGYEEVDIVVRAAAWSDADGVAEAKGKVAGEAGLRVAAPVVAGEVA